MIYSMTGFAKQEWQNNWGKFVWEVRTLNNRYLDVNLRLPDLLRDLEMGIREKVRSMVQRGKIDLFLRVQFDAKMQTLEVDEVALQHLQSAAKKVENIFPNANLDLVKLLQWPGVLRSEEISLPALQEEILQSLEQLLTKLLEARQREGAVLQQIIYDRLQEMKQYVQQAKAVMPEVLTMQREKLVQRIQDAQVSYVPERLEQELVMMAQRIDIDEEIERLNLHIIEVERILKSGGAIGRRLDFLVQELHREANTLGSKSAHPVTTKASVELKVLIEQIREQVQNIE